jgi:hypothetical protein
METTRTSRPVAKKTEELADPPAERRYVAKEDAPKAAVLTCAILNLFFEDDFTEDSPRGQAFGYFLNETDETNVCAI